MNTRSIASLTVCYNGAEALPYHIDALSCQQRELQEIIVVDNGSSDGTRELLAQRYPHVTVLSLRENVGVAGGFRAGLTYAATKRKYDWVWLFDQDSVPRIDAATNLEKAMTSMAGAVDDIGVFACIGVNSRAKARYYPQLWRDGFVKPSEAELHAPIWFADFAMSSGSLLKREVVESVGLPRPDFFMDATDFEYCLRIRKHGYRIAVVNTAKLEHSMGNPRRARFLGISKVLVNHAPWRQYYLARNPVYVVWWLYPTRKAKWFMIFFLARHAFTVLLFHSQKLSSLKKIYQGLQDGRRAKLGIRFVAHGEFRS